MLIVNLNNKPALNLPAVLRADLLLCACSQKLHKVICDHNRQHLAKHTTCTLLVHYACIAIYAKRLLKKLAHIFDVLQAFNKYADKMKIIATKIRSLDTMKLAEI